jgi:hypothetical protein
MKCKKCDRPTVGKSRYCYEHRAESRANFKQMCQEQAAERRDLETRFHEVYKWAERAGRDAGESVDVTPMVVVERSNPLDDSSPIKNRWDVPDGVCGFAWVEVHPANCKFANFLKKYHGASKCYRGGVSISIHEYNQSLTRKSAHARAMAEVLRHFLKELDPKARVYAQDRID